MLTVGSLDGDNVTCLSALEWGVIWKRVVPQQSPLLNLHLPEDGQLMVEAVCIAVFCVLCSVCCVVCAVFCVLLVHS